MFEPLKTSGSSGAHDLSFDMLVDKALEKIVNKATAQINDIVDKAVDRAVNKLSTHVKDLQAPTSKDADQQQSVADATAATDDGKTSEHPRQDAMEVRGTTAIVPMQSIRSEDKWPRPNNIYVIHLKNYHDYVLASDDYYATLLRPPADAHPGFFESLYCQWLCEEWHGWLFFRNMDTGKYLGLRYDWRNTSKPVLSADHDRPANDTRFCAMLDEFGNCVLRVPMNDRLLSIQAVVRDDRDLQYQLGNLKQEVALLCRATIDGTLPSSWSFEEVEEVE